MAEHQMFATTEVVPPLQQRGTDLSASQVHRLVTATPERLSLAVLAALCDIFDTDPSELIPIDAVNLGVRKAATGTAAPTTASIDRPAPETARITD